MEIGDDFICYHLICKTNKEEHKLCYSHNWVKLYDVLDDLLKDCKTKRILPSQQINELKKSGKNGIQTLIKKANMGSIGSWSRENFDKVTSLFMDAQLEQIKAKGDGGVWWKSLKAGESHMSFVDTIILAHSDKSIKSNMDLYSNADFKLRVYGILPYSAATVSNQFVTMYMSERFYEIKGEQVVQKFICDLAALASAVKIAKTDITHASEFKNTVTFGFERLSGNNSIKFNQSFAWQEITI